MAVLTKSLPFVELCAKSNYSFLESASHPDEIVQQAKKLNYSAIGITDKMGVYGVARAHLAAQEVGLPLIIGSEIDYHIKILTKNKIGYQSLCHALTYFHLKEKSPWETLLNSPNGNMALLPVATITEERVKDAKDAFNRSAYLLISDFQDGQNWKKKALALQKKFELPIVVSNEPLFHIKKRKPLHDVLRCIQHQKTLKTAGFKLLSNNERHLKSKEALYELFKGFPQWLRESINIAEQCEFSLTQIQYYYPSEWIPKGETSESYLEKLVWKGLKSRYGTSPPSKVIDQIKHELTLVKEMKYVDYFLTTWDIVRFARSKNILCQGRGSAANSIICYLLEITAIDPVRLNLLFERFISRERAEPPDIDIDFEHERREEVIQYLYKRYGRERAAITATVISFRRKSALREVAKVFEISEENIKFLQKLSHRDKLSNLKTDEIKVESLPKQISYKDFKMYLYLAKEIESFPRHLGTHVGGFVLCQNLLSQNVPIEKASMKDRTIIQWDKNDLDSLGFVRVDVLGLGILSAIRKCFDIIKQFYQVELSLATIPPEDPNVYEMCCQADTVGVFQIESRAQMNMLPRLKPRNFFDLIVEIALIRPGPIQGEMVHPYLKRRQKKERPVFLHKGLKKILEKTYGVPIFQEQIMKMAIEVGNFSPGKADELRRAMGSWRKDGTGRLDRLGEELKANLIKNGVPHHFADQIFNQIRGFAEYGFPESHAASFAILAYASAYLKLYYPDAFLCALLNSQPMGFYSIHTLVSDAKRHGVIVLPVDVLSSSWENTIYKKNNVKLGLREVYGLKKQIGLSIEELPNKEKNHNLIDWVESLRNSITDSFLCKRDLFLLASADAFRCFNLSRRQALWEIQSLNLKDSYLFHYEDNNTDKTHSLPKETPWEKVSFDYEATGTCLHTHPMSLFRAELKKEGVLDSKEVLKRSHTRKKVFIKTAGVVIARQMPHTAKGTLFITLEDENGFINLVIWKDCYKKFKSIILSHSFLLVAGYLQKATDGNVTHLIVENVLPLLQPEQPTYQIPSYDFH